MSSRLYIDTHGPGELLFETGAPPRICFLSLLLYIPILIVYRLLAQHILHMYVY
jgi:hypothetical protein